MGEGLKIDNIGIKKKEFLEEGIEHFRELLKIDTSNPPGNETEACYYLKKIFSQNGIETTIIESSQGRGNLVTKLEGEKERNAILLSGHLDVVPAMEKGWTHPPFAGVVDKGFVWGRGAVDMKNMITYSLMTFLTLKRLGISLKRNIIFAGFADEEDGSSFGCKYIVQNFPHLLSAEYALNETGGFTLHTGGKKLYPVQVANRGHLWLNIKVKGKSGHGSIPDPQSSIMKLIKGIDKLTKTSFGFSSTNTAKEFISEIAESFGGLKKIFLKMLLWKSLHKTIIKLIPDKTQARYFYSILNNTLTPTMLQSGVRVNVIPDIAEAKIDIRLLPGFKKEEILKKIIEILGNDFEIEILSYSNPVEVLQKGEVFEEIQRTIKDMDRDGKVIPYILSGVTDASYLAEIGIKTIGFTPVKLPEDIKFSSLFHAVDERIPLEGFKWGLETYLELILRLAT